MRRTPWLSWKECRKYKIIYSRVWIGYDWILSSSHWCLVSWEQINRNFFSFQYSEFGTYYIYVLYIIYTHSSVFNSNLTVTARKDGWIADSQQLRLRIIWNLERDLLKKRDTYNATTSIRISNLNVKNFFRAVPGSACLAIMSFAIFNLKFKYRRRINNNRGRNRDNNDEEEWDISSSKDWLELFKLTTQLLSSNRQWNMNECHLPPLFIFCPTTFLCITTLHLLVTNWNCVFWYLKF